MFDCYPGDILMYDKPPNFSTHLIVDGEHLEDPGQSIYFYHVAVALDAKAKIEANEHKVAIADIDYGNFLVFRPPISAVDVFKGLDAVKKLEGQGYDYLMILDDTLRFATENLVHLPDDWVADAETHRKICNTVVYYYLKAAGHPIPTMPRSPEDVYIWVKDWLVQGGGR